MAAIDMRRPAPLDRAHGALLRKFVEAARRLWPSSAMDRDGSAVRATMR